MEIIKEVRCIEEGLLSFYKGETCYVVEEFEKYYKLKGSDGLFSKCFFEDVVVNPKFEIGDFIKGTTGNYYDVTNQNMMKGIVTRFIILDDDDLKDLDIEVEVIEHSDSYYIGHKYKVNSKYFEPYVAPKLKFKVGDSIESKSTKGIVTRLLENRLSGDNDIEILITEHTYSFCVGNKYEVRSSSFKLREPVTPKYPKVEYLGDGSKVVWNPPYTIIELDGNKGKARCHPDDIYTELDGLKWALKDLVNK